MSLELVLVEATSSFPSKLKSATATDVGPSPATVSMEGKVKTPPPSPRSELTVAEQELAATRSSYPSSFRSADATPLGQRPVGKVRGTCCSPMKSADAPVWSLVDGR